MNTKIIDNRGKVMTTKFSDLEVGDFFQDEGDCTYSFGDSICMKISDNIAIRFYSDGSINEEDWSTDGHYPILPLKAIITVERGD